MKNAFNPSAVYVCLSVCMYLYQFNTNLSNSKWIKGILFYVCSDSMIATDGA